MSVSNTETYLQNGFVISSTVEVGEDEGKEGGGSQGIYDGESVAKLKEILKSRGITFHKDTKKADLIKILEENDAETA